MKETVLKLLNSDESSYSISKGSGVSTSQIQRIRSGERTIEKMQFATVEKLYLYAKSKKISK